MDPLQRLHINLTNQAVTTSTLPTDLAHHYVGGIGLGSYLLWQELDVGTDPLGPENTLYFCIGPAQGTGITLTGRYCLVTKSPLTGFLLDSHAGGAVGPEMAFLGYNVISVTGKADQQVYIHISDDGVEVRPWNHGVGKTTHDTERLLAEEVGDKSLRVISTGLAGENLVPYACLVNDSHRNLGRGGAGAIFGSKNLKAIVFRSHSRKVDRSERVKPLIDDVRSRVKESRDKKHPLESHGTAWLVDFANSVSMYPTRNFSSGFFEGHDQINAEHLEQFMVKKKGCYGCTLSCGFVFKDHPFEWTDEEEVMVPEYETLGLLGGNLGVADVEEVIHMNHLCNALGLDTISAGASMSFLTEANQRGLLPIEWQDHPSIPSFGEGGRYRELLTLIASREGIGSFVALGPAAMAKQCRSGADSFAIQVKGLPMAAWDPRGRFLLGLSYATAAVGASHLRGWSTKLPPPEPFDPSSEKHQQAFEEVLDQMDLKLLKDLLIICHFTHSVVPPFGLEDTRVMLETLTGEDYSMERARDLANRTWLVQRAFNAREMAHLGREPVEFDVLPRRFLDEPLQHEPAKGRTAFGGTDYRTVLHLFYERRGLDKYGRVPPPLLEYLLVNETTAG